MATELGVAYLEIAASTKGFSKTVRSALSDFDAEMKKVTTGKNSFGSRLSTGLQSAFNWSKKLATVVGGIAIDKGLDSALGIDQAQTKLTGLGYSAKAVASIMDNALSSVKGTAFDLQDAANVAASAVAAGIKPGDALTRTLKLVGDAATIAGTDMGSMGAIFNKVAAANKVQMDVIDQLHSAGIPALSLLAKALGVTSEEASKMVSKGKVDFGTFQTAMEAGLGGAAISSTETTIGAWDGMIASLGRVGENLVSKVLPYASTFFNGVMEGADALGPKVGLAADWLVGAFSKAADWARTSLIPALEQVASWIEMNVVPAFKELAEWVQSTVLPALMGFGSWIGTTLVGYLSVMWDWFERNLLPALRNFATEMRNGEGAGGAFIAGISAVSGALIDLGKWLADNRKLVFTILGVWGTWIALSKILSLARIIIDLGLASKAMAVNTAAWVKNMFAMIASKAQTVAIAAMYAKDFVVKMALATGALARNTGSWIANTARAVAHGTYMAGAFLLAQARALAIMAAQTAALIAQKTAQMAVTTATKVATAGQWLFNAALNANPVTLIVIAIAALVAGLIYFFTQTETGRVIWSTFIDWLKAAWDGISSYFSAIWGAITEVFTVAKDLVLVAWQAALDFFTAIPGAIGGFFSTLGSIISAPFSAAKDTVLGVWDAAMGFFRDLPGKIMGFFSGLVETIQAPFRSAFNAIAGFWNNTVGKLSFKAPSWIPGIGGKGWDVPDIPLLATGGTAIVSGTALVGERGPELIHMPRGASVIPLDHPAANLPNAGVVSRADLEYLASLIVGGLSSIAQSAGMSSRFISGLGPSARMGG